MIFTPLTYLQKKKRPASTKIFPILFLVAAGPNTYQFLKAEHRKYKIITSSSHKDVSSLLQSQTLIQEISVLSEFSFQKQQPKGPSTFNFRLF